MYQRIIGRDCTGAENFRFRSTQERSNFFGKNLKPCEPRYQYWCLVEFR